MIKDFFITGLFGERDITIPFDTNYKIIVAENGLGKTTVLNSFYALLSGEISKLRKINFETLGVHIGSRKIVFNKSDFDIDIDAFSELPYYEHVLDKLGPDSFLNLVDTLKKHPVQYFEHTLWFDEISKQLEMPSNLVRDFVENIRKIIKIKSSKKESVSNTQKRILEIQESLGCNTLYLPTYRRIEEDIRSFSVTSENQNIEFGMYDVKQSIKTVTSEITSSSVEWFSKVNGEMLTQLVDGFKISDEMLNSISSTHAVKIVLDRIGDNITDEYKNKILELVNSDKIHEGHESLVYFVANMLKVYRQQQENDKAIQNFATVCNRYLVDKEIVYNESNVTIKVIRKKNQKEIDFDWLSSGEKQLVSLFSMLYLKKDTNLAIFLDEPELSLSIEWQKTFLPDILDSGKCKLLFCTTHSPFIFENKLINITVDLAELTKER